MAFVPQEVQITTSRWEEEADKTFMNTMVQNTVPTSDVWLKYDQRNAKETLSIIYQQSSAEALSPCQLYIGIQPERVNIGTAPEYGLVRLKHVRGFNNM
jgi:hypothetical protein